VRPFRILGVQQIAIGGPSKAALRALWVDLLGVPAQSTFRSERENVDEDILALAGVEIDLMEPIDPDKSPKVHEPRLNHLGLWVDDLAAAVASRACGSRRAGFAKAPPVTTSASFIPRATTSRRAPAKAC